MVKVVGIKFKNSGKLYYFAPKQGDVYERNMPVVVETARGLEYAWVAYPEKFVTEDDIVPPLKPIVRIATQKDTEKSAVAHEGYLLKHDFESEVVAVRDHYMEKGVSEATATAIAKDLLNKKPLQTVVRVKYDIELGHYLNPWNAAFSSLAAAAAGGLLPLLAMVLAPLAWRWEAVILAVIFTSALTGYISSKLGNGLVKVAIVRNIIVGIITVIIHYCVGKMF